MGLLQILDDRQRLRERDPIVAQHRHEPRRVENCERIRMLLTAATHQMHWNRFVGQRLEFERDAHAVRRTPEIRVQREHDDDRPQCEAIAAGESFATGTTRGMCLRMTIIAISVTTIAEPSKVR